jgi:excisionase family DNA binding protein
MKTDIESALVGINHLAECLGLSRRTIHRILARGELPSLQIGRRRLIRLSDLRHWLAGHEGPRPGENLPNIARLGTHSPSGLHQSRF